MTWKETQSAEQPQNGKTPLGVVWFGSYAGMKDGGLWGNIDARWAMSFSDWSSLQPETGTVDLGEVGFFFILSTNHLTGMHAKSLQSCLTTLWSVAGQAPPSMGFSRQEYWSGLPCPPPGDLPQPGIEPASVMSPALAGRFFTISATWEAPVT